MSRRTLLLIIGLCIITGILLYAALTVPNTPVSKTAMQQPATQTSQIAQALLSFDTSVQATPVVPSGTLYPQATPKNSIAIAIDSGSNNISGVQVEIAYDPKVLTNIQVTPGTFFDHPLNLLNVIDKENGRISYALAIQPTRPSAKGRGVVATLWYDLLPTTTSQTSLMFLPKTVVTQEGVNESVLKSATGITIPTTPTTPTVGQTTNQPVTSISLPPATSSGGY